MKQWVAVVLLLCASLAAVGADSLSETRKKAEQGYAGHFGGFIRQFDSHPIFPP